MLKKINKNFLFIAVVFTGKIYGNAWITVENNCVEFETKNDLTKEVSASTILRKVQKNVETIETLYLEKKHFDQDCFDEMRKLFSSLINSVSIHSEKKGYDAICCANSAKANVFQLATVLAPYAKGQIRREIFSLCCELQKIFGWDVKFRQKFLKTMDSLHFWSKAKHVEALALRYGKIIGVAVVCLKLVDFIKKAGKTSSSEKDAVKNADLRTCVQNLAERVLFLEQTRQPDNVVSGINVGVR